MDVKNALLEVRSGSGGDEAAAFARDIFEMYRRFVELKGWEFEMLESSETDLGSAHCVVKCVHVVPALLCLCLRFRTTPFEIPLPVISSPYFISPKGIFRTTRFRPQSVVLRSRVRFAFPRPPSPIPHPLFPSSLTLCTLMVTILQHTTISSRLIFHHSSFITQLFGRWVGRRGGKGG